MDTHHGQIDADTAVSILRDRHNPHTGEDCAADVFFGCDGTLANNGCIHSMVFLPKRRVFYVAMGPLPVPPRRFVGFSVAELLGEPGALPPDPSFIP